MTNTKTYYRRVKQGLCAQCGAGRGKEGTTTLCRECANKARARMLGRTGGGKSLECENCFRDFYPSRGQTTFCDSCAPWFENIDDSSAIDHAREQEQAMKANCGETAESIIDRWQRNLP